MADQRIPAITLGQISVPALDDDMEIVDVSDTTQDASGSSYFITLSRLLGMTNFICQGRLTLTTGVPITSADVTAATSVFFTPYLGNNVALYDGTRWRLYAFTELTLALGTLTSGKNYDVFLYDNSGTLTLEALVWTNDTTRATALVLQNGVPVKTGALTRRYLGTFRTTSTTETEDSLLKRFLWNQYNQNTRQMQVLEGTNTWSYTTDTIRQANGASGNKVEYVVGDAAVLVDAEAKGAALVQTNAGIGAKSGVGVDSTSTFSGTVSGAFNGDLTALCLISMASRYVGRPGVGYHYLSWNEKGADNSCVFYGDDGGSGIQMGLHATLLG